MTNSSRSCWNFQSHRIWTCSSIGTRLRAASIEVQYNGKPGILRDAASPAGFSSTKDYPVMNDGYRSLTKIIILGATNKKVISRPMNSSIEVIMTPDEGSFVVIKILRSKIPL